MSYRLEDRESEHRHDETVSGHNGNDQARCSVSVDSKELERSVLERKDRDELQSIATAMGGKPPSRARKADIVDLILELAGVTTAAPAEADAGGASSTDDVAHDAPPATRAR
jgi:transcription termination factor Rho